MSGEHTGFFYGTLMAREVFYSVCYGQSDPPAAFKKMHTFSPALLEGYCRHRVQYADYPGIIAEEDHRVMGVYVTGLTDANMVKLDYFEGSEYKRQKVKVQLLDAEDGKPVEGEEKEAVTYVYMDPKGLEHKEWDFEQFRKDKLRFWIRDGCANEDPDDKAAVDEETK
ncbi:AIG2-like family-domain-containing protein [Emericellopsis atlantica]|uniref:Putative gamma-glutamylcyclotransferase n=1 Tax=Emericellopsis atlantica TaxID=2614577 RepID=A0A9P8CLD2_9HYPO|nr:AIG2-like family-domain-containing protein [Emericellopsis atlantica]KAG9250890.1 AIG2-like family-domain-containing protein [Emericellopsis atlantica]